MDPRILLAALAVAALSGCLGDDAEPADLDDAAPADSADARQEPQVYHADNADGPVPYMFLTAGPTESTTIRAYESLVPARPEALGGVLVEATWDAPTAMAGDVIFELFQGEGGSGAEPLNITLADDGGVLRAQVPADAWTAGGLVARISAEGAGGAGAQMSVEYHLYATVFEGDPDWSATAIAS